MFVETAALIRAWLTDLPLDGARVVNFGSSTEDFWRERQPYIWRDVMAPIAARGLLLNVDAKLEMQEIPAGWLPDLILCCSVLEHVEDPMALLDEFWEVLSDGGRLLLDVPASYPHHPDPIDNGLRWRKRAECELALAAGWEIERFVVVARAGTTHSAALVLARRI